MPPPGLRLHLASPVQAPGVQSWSRISAGSNARWRASSPSAGGVPHARSCRPQLARSLRVSSLVHPYRVLPLSCFVPLPRAADCSVGRAEPCALRRRILLFALDQFLSVFGNQQTARVFLRAALGDQPDVVLDHQLAGCLMVVANAMDFLDAIRSEAEWIIF